MRQVLIGVLISMSLAVGGCSPVPIAGTYPVTTEQKMQSVHHWQVLADQAVIAAVQAGLSPSDPVYVPPHPAPSLFGQALLTYITTDLSKRGFVVTPVPAPHAATFDYSVQIAQFAGKDAEAIPGLFTAAGVGGWAGYQGATHWPAGSGSVAAGAIPAGIALDLLAGGLATQTNTEVIVTVGITQDQRTIYRDSKNYYIADGDAWQYASSAQLDTGHAPSPLDEVSCHVDSRVFESRRDECLRSHGDTIEFAHVR